jgi:hypothetical protein
MMDKRLFLTAKFTNVLGESFSAPIVSWQDHLAQIDKPKYTMTTLVWREPGKHWRGMTQAKVTKEPGLTWINPQDPGWQVSEQDNLYNRAIKAVGNGLIPGQEVVLWEKGSKKAFLKRDKAKEEIRLVIVNAGIKSVRFAWWGLDVESVSGRNGKWVLISQVDYLKWVEETK